MIIETVDHEGAQLLLIAEHISSVECLDLDECWVVYMVGGQYHEVQDYVAQGILKHLKTIHCVREVLP